MAKIFADIAEEKDKNIRKLVGNKVRLDDWLNKTIKITNYRITPSKYKSCDCLHLEFYYEGEPHILFTASSNLIYLVKKYLTDDEPIECQIVKKDGQLTLI